MDDGVPLSGIVYVLGKGKVVSRRDVPAERIGCSGVTCWRRMRDWTEAGVWPRLHETLLVEVRGSGLHTGPSPVDRGRPGSRHHLIVERHGTPLAVSLPGGNRHDVTS